MSALLGGVKVSPCFFYGYIAGLEWIEVERSKKKWVRVDRNVKKWVEVGKSGLLDVGVGNSRSINISNVNDCIT